MELVFAVESTIIWAFKILTIPNQNTSLFTSIKILSRKTIIFSFLNSLSVKFVFFKLSFIDILVWLKLAQPLSHIVMKFSLVIRSVFHYIYSLSLCLSHFPLSKINRTILLIKLAKTLRFFLNRYYFTFYRVPT